MALGRTDDAVAFARAAVALEGDPRYDPFSPGWSRLWEAAAHAYAGRIDRWLDISTELLDEPGLPRLLGLCGMLYALPPMGRAEEATAIAAEAVDVAWAYGNPAHIAYALFGYARAYADVNPAHALAASRAALAYAHEQRMPYWETSIALQLAGLEAQHGEAAKGLELFDTALERFSRAGRQGALAITLTSFAIFLERYGRPELAATVYGASTNYASIHLVANLSVVVARLRSTLGQAVFDASVADGAAMETAAAALFARQQIDELRRALQAS